MPNKPTEPNFFVTFGFRYHEEPHPSGLEVNPDAVFGIVADDYSQAREIAFKHLGRAWCFVHGIEELEDLKRHFPLGVTTILTEEGVRGDE